MAAVKISIRQDGFVFTYNPRFEARGFRTAMFDTETRSEILPGGQLVPLAPVVAVVPAPPKAPALPAEPTPPAQLEVLQPDRPPPPEVQDVGADGAPGDSADGSLIPQHPDVMALEGKAVLREYSIATFGKELPGRWTEEHMRKHLNALHCAQEGTGAK